MGRPSGGGGGRGGGSRPSGGSRGGGHRSAGSSRSMHRPSGGGSYRPSGGMGGPSRGGYHGGPGMPPPPHHYHGGPGYPPPRRHYRRTNPITNMISTLIVVLFLLIVMSSMGMFNGSRVSINNNTYANTTERTKLDSSVTKETDYYYDELGYINQESVLLKGLQYFYSKTGVQPVIYITDNREAQAASLYDEICSDEGHFLLVVIGSKDGSTDWEYDYQWGVAAGSIMNKEAEDIFFAYLDSYYYGSYTDEEVFANAFKSTADTIMSSTTNGFDVLKVVIIGVVIIIVLLILVNFWKARKAQKNKEQADLEKTLNTPLEEFGDSSLNDLKEKYDEK